MKVEISIPCFSGFYESIWSYNMQDSLDREIEERGITMGDDWSCKKSEYENAVARKFAQMYVDVLNSDLDLGMKICDEPFVDSPKYYNYRTDRIYVVVEFSAIRKLRVLMSIWENELRKIIHENHTSHSGFVSFMSNNFDEWVKIALKYDYEEFGLYLSYALHYVIGLQHGWDLDNEFYDWICGDVSAEWYPDSEAAKEELEKVEIVEDAFGFGSYDSSKWGEMSVEECRLDCERRVFDAKYQLTFNF